MKLLKRKRKKVTDQGLGVTVIGKKKSKTKKKSVQKCHPCAYLTPTR